MKLEGYDLVQAAHGEAALDFLLKTDRLPSLILLDLLTPVMDGWQFREIQRHHLKLAHIPVMLMASGPVDEEHLASLGVVTFFKKSTDLSDIRRTIRDFLEGTFAVSEMASREMP